METTQEANRRRQRNYRERHLEQNRKRQRDWKRQERVAHPERVIARSYARGIWQRYRLTVEQYESKLASQNGMCSLCGEPFDENVGALKPVLDHNHETNKIRDFLHNNCNRGMGMLGDRIVKLVKAAEYLRRHGSN